MAGSNPSCLFKKEVKRKMAYINARSFVYDGISSDSFDLCMGWLSDNNEQDLQTGLEVELRRGEMNMVRSRPNHYGAIYNDTLSFEFVIFPKRKLSFTFSESAEINKWLRKSNTYKRLRFIDDESEFINFQAVCTNIIDIVRNGLNAKQLTFVCDSPFGYMEEIKKVLTTTGSSPKDYKIYNLSDNGIYYPRVKITVLANYNGTIKVQNVGDDKTLTVKFDQIIPYNGEKAIILDGEKNLITDGSGKVIPAYKIGWDNTDNIYWVRLLENTNTIRVTGASTITLYMTFPRKVGVI